MSTPWSVEDLTPEELANLEKVLNDTETDGMPCCMDSEDAGVGDDNHGIDQS